MQPFFRHTSNGNFVFHKYYYTIFLYRYERGEYRSPYVLLDVSQFSLMGKFVSGPTIYRCIEFVTESQVLGTGARAWHTTMSAFLEIEGCEIVVFEKSMWRVVIDGHRILLDAHMDDLVIACANRRQPLTLSENFL